MDRKSGFFFDEEDFDQHSKVEDFFFGELLGFKIQLTHLLKLSKQVPSAYFNQQINRLLSECSGQIIIERTSSRPDFEGFLKNIDLSEIGKIEIERRTDITDKVESTIVCSIWLPQGVCHFKTYWCSNTHPRAKELVSTLLAPLHQLGLTSKVFVKNDGSLTPLDSGNKYLEELSKVFNVDQDYAEEYVEIISNADGER